MRELEPTEALTICERSLRQLVSKVLRRDLGAEWIQSVATADQITKWQERRVTEAANRAKRGAIQVEQHELAYAEFYELLDIVERNWDKLAPALGKKKETGALLRRFEDLRNTVAHSRTLLPFEMDLLSGIAGEVRNRVAIYMSSTDPTGQLYPTIDSIMDSFGTVVDQFNLKAAVSAYVDADVKLRPGDAVTFSCSGTDPQGRELQWRVVVGVEVLATVDGNSVHLVWQVGHNHVAHETPVEIHLITRDTPYHRWWSTADQIVSISYEVLPPGA